MKLRINMPTGFTTQLYVYVRYLDKLYILPTILLVTVNMCSVGKNKESLYLFQGLGMS